MGCVYSLVVPQSVRVIAVDRNEGTEVCRGHRELAVYFVGGHDGLHRVGPLYVKDVVVLHSVEKVRVFLREDVEQLVR